MSEVGLAFPGGVVNAVDATEVEKKPWEPLRGLAGVNHKVVWRSQEMIVGLVRIDPGAEEPGHAHADAQHHVYVLQGSARVGGTLVGTGGFVFVPAGVEHAITDVGADGCTLFYTFATVPGRAG
jgi:quercetin dioxygenase-like cupin family protein